MLLLRGRPPRMTSRGATPSRGVRRTRREGGGGAGADSPPASTPTVGPLRAVRRPRAHRAGVHPLCLSRMASCRMTRSRPRAEAARGVDRGGSLCLPLAHGRPTCCLPAPNRVPSATDNAIISSSFGTSPSASIAISARRSPSPRAVLGRQGAGCPSTTRPEMSKSSGRPALHRHAGRAHVGPEKNRPASPTRSDGAYGRSIPAVSNLLTSVPLSGGVSRSGARRPPGGPGLRH